MDGNKGRRGRNVGQKSGSANAKVLVGSLLAYANYELGEEETDYLQRLILAEWSDAEWSENDLCVRKTTLEGLVELTEICHRSLKTGELQPGRYRDTGEAHPKTEAVRTALHYLKQQKICDDGRGNNYSRTRTNAKSWSFVLKLPSRKKEELTQLFSNEDPSELNFSYPKILTRDTMLVNRINVSNSLKFDHNNVKLCQQNIGEIESHLSSKIKSDLQNPIITFQRRELEDLLEKVRKTITSIGSLDP